MVTARPGLADSGAQFLRRNATFQAYIERWLEAGWCTSGRAAGATAAWTRPPTTGSPRYAVRGGMQAWPPPSPPASTCAWGVDHLAFSDRVRLAAVDQNGESYDARAVILTLPIPTALALPMRAR